MSATLGLPRSRQQVISIPMLSIGFHTDAFNSSYWSFEQCLAWSNRQRLNYIECGAIDGVSWIHGLGYRPHVALWQDPLQLRRR